MAALRLLTGAGAAQAWAPRGRRCHLLPVQPLARQHRGHL